MSPNSTSERKKVKIQETNVINTHTHTHASKNIHKPKEKEFMASFYGYLSMQVDEDYREVAAPTSRQNQKT